MASMGAVRRCPRGGEWVRRALELSEEWLRSNEERGERRATAAMNSREGSGARRGERRRERRERKERRKDERRETTDDESTAPSERK